MTALTHSLAPAGALSIHTDTVTDHLAMLGAALGDGRWRKRAMCEQGGFVGKARPVTCSSALLPSPPESSANLFSC